MSSSEELETLDLYDVALILNYERMTTEPRFRHAKLREVAFPGERLKTVRFHEDPSANSSPPCTSLLFERPAGLEGQIDMGGPPDLPSNMLAAHADSPELETLTSKQLETLFHQARNHDGCYSTVGLLQHFFDLFDSSTPLRIRHGPQGKTPGKVYTTTVDERFILEMTLVNPKFITFSTVLPDGISYSLGDDPTYRHAVIGFTDNPNGNMESILDLSSMQFGDYGRGPGPKGQGLFVLDTINEFYERLDDIIEFEDINKRKMSERIRSCPQDPWLKQVAKKAKERWEKRDTEKWCGHCGAPRAGGAANRCSGCRNAWYCNGEHQRMAWPFHKQYCTKTQPVA